MAQRFEWYSGPMNEVTRTYDPFWKGQSSTPQVTHKITSVRLYCYRVYSALSFKLTTDIYVAPSNSPSGPSLVRYRQPCCQQVGTGLRCLLMPLTPYSRPVSNTPWRFTTQAPTRITMFTGVSPIPEITPGVSGLTEAARTIPEMVALRNGVNYCLPVDQPDFLWLISLSPKGQFKRGQH